MKGTCILTKSLLFGMYAVAGLKGGQPACTNPPFGQKSADPVDTEAIILFVNEILLGLPKNIQPDDIPC